MQRLARSIVVLTGLCLLSGCGSRGHSADAPTGLTATPGDGRATLTWTMAADTQYWAFYASANSISIDNWTTLPGGKALMNVSSPLAVSGLVNGTTYAFTINARVDGGPGGPGTPSVTAIPRLAGSTWTTGAPLGTGDLNAVTYGSVGGNVFVAVGANGRIFSSPDGTAWTTLNSPVSTVDLNAIAFGGASYAAAGGGGTILYSTDAANWISVVSGSQQAINGLATNGANAYVAVGDKGTILYSLNGTTWTTAASGTMADLRAIAYGNGRYVAVGAGGVLLSSTDAVNWTPQASNTTLNLRSVAYGITDPTTSTTLFVATGASGALVSSVDGLTWTPRAALPAINANSITFGSQFVLVGDSGAIYTSTTGTTWQAQPSGTPNNLKAVTHNPFGYSAVGAAGTNLLAI